LAGPEPEAPGDGEEGFEDDDDFEEDDDFKDDDELEDPAGDWPGFQIFAFFIVLLRCSRKVVPNVWPSFLNALSRALAVFLAVG